MTSLRVLACVFSCCPPGSPGFKSGEDLLGWQMLLQIGRRHEVWALTHLDNRSSIEKSLQGEIPPGVNFHYVGLPFWLRPMLRFQGSHQLYAYLWQIRVYFAARLLHQRMKFDLFHHITYANDWMPSFIGALLPVPFIRGPGGGAHRTPKGLEQEYTLGGRIWERVRSVSQWIFRRDPFFRRGQAKARAILLCNRESISQVPGKWSDKVHEFPVNGIATEDLASNNPGGHSAGSMDRSLRIMTAGSLIRVKGFGLAIKAFAKFSGRYPESSFTIVGSGPEEPRLRGLVKRYRLQKRVNFIQSMPRDELLEEMSCCDVFLFPSLRDGGGAVVIEAMARGKPVVCLETGGPAMHITEESGIKIVPGTSEQSTNDLADALEHLCLDSNLRRRLGIVAATRAKEVYHWDRLGERLMGIYHQIIDAKSSG